MENKNTYKIQDLVRALDRDKTTILRWEKQGYIPPAKRDSRGWRYYTDDDFRGIVKKVKEAHYFNRRLAALIVVFILVINVVAFFSLSKFALGNANMNANLNVVAGSLSVAASTTVTAFTDVTYALWSQTTTASNVGATGVSDLRGGAGTWTFNISCADSANDCMWKGSTRMNRFAMFQSSTGTFPSTSGVLCVDLSQNRCVAKFGDPCTNVSTQTAVKCFSSAKTDLSYATGADANGEYWFAETDWSQSVPGLATASLYTTTLIWDLTRNSDDNKI